MPKTRKEKQAAAKALTDAAGIRLRQPDRTGPKSKTLIDFAGDRSLFAQADERQRQLNKERGLPEDTNIIKSARKVRKANKAKDGPDSDDDNETDDDSDDDSDDGDDDDDDEPLVSPFAERVFDTLLWCVSLAMLHVTLDVLVQNQYAMELEWPVIVRRGVGALGVFSVLFYNLHRHPSDPRLLFFRFGQGRQDRLRQVLFFAVSAVAGSYLVHITNEYSYLAMLEQAPPIGCLWVWAVIELDLLWAVGSLAVAGTYAWLHGYGIR